MWLQHSHCIYIGQINFSICYNELETVISYLSSLQDTAIKFKICVIILKKVREKNVWNKKLLKS